MLVIQWLQRRLVHPLRALPLHSLHALSLGLGALLRELRLAFAFALLLEITCALRLALGPGLRANDAADYIIFIGANDIRRRLTLPLTSGSVITTRRLRLYWLFI